MKPFPSYERFLVLLFGAAGALLASGACSSDDTPVRPSSTTGPGGTTGAAGSTATGGTSSGGSGGSAGATTDTTGGAGGGGGGGSAGASGSSGSAGNNDAGAKDAPSGDGSGGCNTSPGKALQFDGNIVDLMTGDLGADFPGGDVPRTIELWAKYTGASSWTPEHSLMETGLRQGTNGNMVFGFDNSGYTGTTAEFGPYTNGYSDNNPPNGVFVMNIPQSGWIHLSWSYTGNHGTLSFTVNGTEHAVKTLAGAPTMNFTPGIVTLGASQAFGTQGWTGVMDEVRLWSVAKTPADIQRDMKVVLKGNEPGLVAYYRFDEGSGAFTDDVTKKPSHRLSTCTATSMRCVAVNAASPRWVDSDLPGPFTCAP
jgi:hypothetical protein